METGVPVTFDASESSDDQLPGVPLVLQWDWDGDGTYDTPESTIPRTTHLFRVAGRTRVALLVPDQRGATNRVEREIDVTPRPDPGWALTGQPALDLPFVAAAMWVDPSGGHAYFTDPAGKRLVRMPLPSGIPDREWRFEFPAEALAASPDGTTLYVSELVIPRSSFNFGRQAGLIGVLDVTTGVLLRKFPTDLDPAQLLAVGNGPLLVGGGSAQGTQLKSYDTSDGTVLGMGEVRENSALLPRGPYHVLALTTFGLGAEVTQFRIGTDGTLSQERDASALLPESVWAPWAVSPDGRSILSGNGYRLSVPADPSLPVVFEGRLPVEPGDDFQGAVAFDLAERKAAFRGTRNRVDWHETASWSRIRSFETVPVVRFLGLWSDRLVVAGTGGRGTRVQLLRNPAAGAESNQPPVVKLTTKGDSFSTATEVQFDASETTDVPAASRALEFRWDWTDDGVFDTEFSTAPKASHRYFIAGNQVARVQVRDGFGATASGTVAFTVVVAADPGFAGRTNTAFQLPFSAAGVAFDGPRRRAFVSDAQAREVVAVDLDSGLEIRRWTVPGIPERMATTPDSRRLYVALPTAAHQYSSPVPNGHVVEFDLPAMAMTRLIPVETDPWDVAATDEGLLVVSSGSNQFAPLDAYRLSDGVRTSRITARFQSRLLLDPDQAVVWALTTDSNPQASVRLDLNPTLSSFAVGFETYGEPLGPTIAAPLGGNRTLDARGRILDTRNPFQVLSAPSEAPAVFEGALLAGGSWIVATSPDGVRYLAPGDAAWLPWAGTPAGKAWIGPVGDRHGLATVGVTATEFTLRSLPARDTSSNQTPVVTWTEGVPEGIAVPGSVELRARMDDQDGVVVSAELWAGDTKLTDLLPKSPYFVASIGSPGTNRFRIIARDNLGAQSTSAEQIVIGRSPPSVSWLEPSFPVVEPGAAFALEVTVTPGEGPVSRVEFSTYEAGRPGQTLTATAPPWRVTLPGILGDARLMAVAYDDLGIASRETPWRSMPSGRRGMTSTVPLFWRAPNPSTPAPMHSRPVKPSNPWTPRARSRAGPCGGAGRRRPTVSSPSPPRAAHSTPTSRCFPEPGSTRFGWKVPTRMPPERPRSAS